MKTLFNWQEEAMLSLYENNKLTSGIIEAVTGSGKTMLGLSIINDNSTKKILVITPTIVLAKQWFDEIIKYKLSTSNNLGIYYSRYKKIGDITVAVINSIRNINLVFLEQFDIVIVDECHHLPSDKNIKIFEKLKNKVIIGLTSVLQREDGRHILLDLPVKYRYTHIEATKEKVISDFIIIVKYLDLLEDEKLEYGKINSFINSYFKEFNYDFNTVKQCITNPVATELMRGFQKRKNIIYNSKAKIIEVFKILNFSNYNKSIIFTETKEMANKLSEFLIKNNIKNNVYKSDSEKVLKDIIIEDFKNGFFNVLISPKCLDEGVDLPECDLGIIVSGSSTKRQFIQRIGRILRKKDNIAKLYILCCRNTVEEKWINKYLKNIDKNKVIYNEN